MIIVNFEHTVDWRWFLEGLNKSLPEGATVDFRFSNPLQHPFFLSFISGLKRRWRMETTLAGPGLGHLMANTWLAENCEEIVAQFSDAALSVGLIQWTAQAAKLHNAGYNVRAEVPRQVKPEWLTRFTAWPIRIKIDIVPNVGQHLAHPRGFSKTEERNCNGELALVWSDGKYYPCEQCIFGGLKGPAYAYGELGESFEKKGKEGCRLRYCPLSFSVQTERD